MHNLTGVFLGEIISVQENTSDNNSNLYVCEITWSGGSLAIIRDVRIATRFGGIGDYQRRRARGRQDAIEPSEYTDSEIQASVGERIYLAFASNNIMNPVILGFADHPNQTEEFDDGDDIRSVEEYLGVRTTIDKYGQFSILRKGAPATIFKPQEGGLGGVASALGGGANSAIKPVASSNWSSISMLAGGVLKLADSQGGTLDLNARDDRVFLGDKGKSANDLDDEGEDSAIGFLLSQEGDFLLLDRTEGHAILNGVNQVTIYAEDARRDETDGDFFHAANGNVKWQVQGDWEDVIVGTRTQDIFGDEFLDVTGNTVWDIIGDIDFTTQTGSFTVDALQDIILTATAGTAVLKLSGGQVAIGGAGGTELLELITLLIEKVMSLSLAVQNHDHIGNLGYAVSSALLSSNILDFTSLDNEILADVQIPLQTIKGSL